MDQVLAKIIDSAYYVINSPVACYFTIQKRFAFEAIKSKHMKRKLTRHRINKFKTQYNSDLVVYTIPSGLSLCSQKENYGIHHNRKNVKPASGPLNTGSYISFYII